MTVSVIVPCHNEARTIREIITRVDALAFGKQIIIVDDGSTDETPEVLRELKSNTVHVIRHDENRGKGCAIRTALAQATGDVVVIQDGDLEYDPSDLERMLFTKQENGWRVIYGSRVLGNSPWSGVGYYLGGRFLSLLTNVLYGSRITDEPTCYKMFDRDILDSLHLTSERFEFCPEVTAKILRLGHTIHEIPISYAPRSLQAGKKIKFRDGMEAIWTLLRIRFMSRSLFSQEKRT